MSALATVLAVYRVDPADRATALTWQAAMDAAAGEHMGFVASRVARGFAEHDDWAASVTFTDERHLHEWLASPERAEMLARGDEQGVHSVATILLMPGQSPPAGTAVFFHRVSPGDQAAFVQAETALQAAARAYPGHVGGLLLPPSDEQGRWISVSRFDSDAALARWLDSPERAACLATLRPLLEGDFVTATRSTPFGSIVRVEGGATVATPQWKTAMVVLMVLYPTVMLLSRFLNPTLANWGIDPGLMMWIGQVVSTVLLTWVLMPLATRVFRRWLDPVDGAGTKVTVVGAAVVTLAYLATLVFFLSVRDLQWWDYPR